jgi:hypothetical protein
MKKLLGVSLILLAGGAIAFGQPRSKPAAEPVQTKPAASKPVPAEIPAAVPVAEGTGLRGGSVSGRTYRNKALGFEVTFPMTWVIPGDDFEAEMKKAGFDLSLSPPPSVGAVDRAKMNKALQQVSILLTAYRSLPGSMGNAIVRISLEDLSMNPQIKDAVDYFDAMRAQFKTMKLPPDFKYSETQAEQLGKHQFGFLDSSGNGGKKRLYATVRNGYAVLFSISYAKDEDLQVLRRVLSEGNFALK